MEKDWIYEGSILFFEQAIGIIRLKYHLSFKMPQKFSSRIFWGQGMNEVVRSSQDPVGLVNVENR